MTKWLIKHQKYEFIYDSKKDIEDIRWSQLELEVRKEGLIGWEPWSIEVKHNFNTDYTQLFTMAVVWYKRTESE